jgi:hypothetical protein
MCDHRTRAIIESCERDRKGVVDPPFGTQLALILDVGNHRRSSTGPGAPISVEPGGWSPLATASSGRHDGCLQCDPAGGSGHRNVDAVPADIG